MWTKLASPMRFLTGAVIGLTVFGLLALYFAGPRAATDTLVASVLFGAVGAGAIACDRGRSALIRDDLATMAGIMCLIVAIAVGLLGLGGLSILTLWRL